MKKMEKSLKTKKKLKKNLKISKTVEKKSDWHECYRCICSFPIVQLSGVRSYFILRECVIIIIGVCVGCSLAPHFSNYFSLSYP